MIQIMAFARLHFNPVSFVRSSEVLDTISVKTKTGKTKTKNLDGNNVRTFYEGIVGLNDSGLNRLTPGPSASIQQQVVCDKQIKTEKSEKSSRKPPIVHCEKDCNLFLRYAQEDDLKGVKRYISDGIDINTSDHYGWTAMMCAAKAGNYKLVQYLVENGASLECKDYKHRTVTDMTKCKKILKYLHDHQTGHVSDSEDVKVPTFDKFFCELCKREFTDTTRQTHETSTLHLFNSKLKPKSNHIYLPSTNKGYQMMVHDGWDEERGLGPHGAGYKHPIKTVLKRDRKGLGIKSGKAKVTHFSPNDADAIKRPKAMKERQMKATTLSKKVQRKKMSKEKRKEVAFRREFYAE